VFGFGGLEHDHPGAQHTAERLAVAGQLDLAAAVAADRSFAVPDQCPRDRVQSVDEPPPSEQVLCPAGSGSRFPTASGSSRSPSSAPVAAPGVGPAQTPPAVRSAGTGGRTARCRPPHSTVPGIVGTRSNCSRIASSNESTADPDRFRSYLGGPSEAIAARTVFREIPNVLAIVLIPNPSARWSRRISAQSSTDDNSLRSSDSR